LNSKDSLAYNNRGWCYFNLAQYNEAIANYNQAIELNPQYIQAYYNRGLAYESNKQLEEAKEDFEKVLTLKNEIKVKYDTTK
jgi:tetratricopeptide (TPR) repeat protein